MTLLTLNSMNRNWRSRAIVWKGVSRSGITSFKVVLDNILSGVYSLTFQLADVGLELTFVLDI